MSDKEFKEMKIVLSKQLKEVSSSKEAARKLLDSLGMLTPTGKIKKAYIVPQKNVSI
jgi:hypothetical protein